MTENKEEYEEAMTTDDLDRAAKEWADRIFKEGKLSGIKLALNILEKQGFKEDSDCHCETCELIRELRQNMKEIEGK